MNAAAKPRRKNRTKAAYACENCGREHHPCYTSARRFCSVPCAVAGLRVAEAARIAAIPAPTPEKQRAMARQIAREMQTALAELQRIIERQENE